MKDQYSNVLQPFIVLMRDGREVANHPAGIPDDVRNALRQEMSRGELPARGRVFVPRRTDNDRFDGGPPPFRLSEFAMHQWDVAVAFDPAATLAPEAVPLLIDHVTGLLGWIAKPETLKGRTATLALRLREPDRTLGLDLGESVELTGVPDQPDGELSLPAESWLRLAFGRLGPRHTPGGVDLTGPLTLDDLRAVFPGF